MKAVFFHRHGGPEVLHYAEFPTPDPSPGEIQIRLRAAALNRMDILVRNGWPGLKLDLPHINGADGAGEISALGEGSQGFNIRDRVVINPNLGCGKCDWCLSGWDNRCRSWHLLGETIRGTYAEYICLPERQAFAIPVDFEFHDAAAAALVYQTAWHSLVTRGSLQEGETVVIVGAGGGVNSASIQIAKHFKARVIVVGSNASKLERARSVGADVLIDRSVDEDWPKIVHRVTEKRGAELVVDNVGTTFPSSLRALAKGGRLLTVGNSGGARFEIDNRYVFAKHLSIIGSTMSRMQEFKTVMDLLVKGSLTPIRDLAFPLKEAARAQERLWRGEQFGKITLDID